VGPDQTETVRKVWEMVCLWWQEGNRGRHAPTEGRCEIHVRRMLKTIIFPSFAVLFLPSFVICFMAMDGIHKD
jgi:hypothetical protein